MELKLLRDKYIANPDGSDSCHVAGDIIDADPERAEVWIRRGHAEKANKKSSAEKKE